MRLELSRPTRKRVGNRSVQVGAVEVHCLQVGLAEVRLLQVSTVEVRLLQVGLAEVCAFQPGGAEVGPLQMGTDEVYRIQTGSAEVRPLQVGAEEVRPLEVGAEESRGLQVDAVECRCGPLQVRVGEVCPLQVGAMEQDPIQTGAAEVQAMRVGVGEVRPLQVGIEKIGPLQVGAEEVRPLQVSTVEVRSLQVRAGEMGVPQIDGVQVKRTVYAFGICEAATAKNRQDRLDVGCSDLQLSHLADWSGGDVLAGQGWRPGSTAADVGGQYLSDRGAVGGRVAGNPLQRIDPTKPHVKLWVAELVDRAGEPLGDLSLSAGVELPVGEVGADEHDNPTEALQQGRSDFVLGPQSQATGHAQTTAVPPPEPRSATRPRQ